IQPESGPVFEKNGRRVSRRTRSRSLGGRRTVKLPVDCGPLPMRGRTGLQPGTGCCALAYYHASCQEKVVMNCRRVLLSSFAALGLCWTVPAPASAGFVTIETLTVDSSAAAPTFSHVTLSAGETYRLRVSGFYLFNNFPGLGNRQADVEYVSEDSFMTYGS